MADIPAEADKALQIIRKFFPHSLIASYLHGSFVTGGLRPYSDVDILAVIDCPMKSEDRNALAAELMMISGLYPHDIHDRRPLEVIIFQKERLSFPFYQIKAEFIYGEWLRTEYFNGKISEPVFDPEFLLILAQIRQKAHILTGAHPDELLPVIPLSVIYQAIADILPSLLISLKGDERNVLLTLARIWYTLSTGAFTSKDKAAKWSISMLPPGEAAVISAARKAYMGSYEKDWNNCRNEVTLTVNILCAHIQKLLSEHLPHKSGQSNFHSF